MKEKIQITQDEIDFWVPFKLRWEDAVTKKIKVHLYWKPYNMLRDYFITLPSPFGLSLESKLTNGKGVCTSDKLLS